VSTMFVLLGLGFSNTRGAAHCVVRKRAVGVSYSTISNYLGMFEGK